MPIKKKCRVSGKEFIVSDSDMEFYAKIDVPAPTLSPDERCRRRFAFRNERSLHLRKSSSSNQDIVSCIHPDDPWPVYTPEEWWGDSWDAATFGRSYDFNRTFFEQYFELQELVPTISISGVNNHNSQYSNYAASCKNCHLIFGSINCEDCLYGNPYNSRSCIDALLLRDCELCYESVTCERCYECFYCQDCVGCNNMLYSYDCIGCSDCIGSVGLRNKQYHIFNKKYSKEDYEKAKAELNLSDSAQVAELRRKFEALKLEVPRKHAVLLKTQNVSGNYIYSSKNTFESFDVQRCEDTSYSAQVIDMKDCHDCNYTEENELCYEYICNYKNQRIFFSVWTYNCSDIFYSSYCVSSKNLFGSIGMRNKQYCILNKQYSQEEYVALKARIIEHMKSTGEWGEFFPVWTSLFAYNETVAQEYFPLSKAEAISRGYRWRDIDPKDYLPQSYELPASISDVGQDILQARLACNECSKNYRIEKIELQFYKRYEIPIPTDCPDCRHKKRMQLRNPRQLWDRKCVSCQDQVQSSYSQSRPEKIHCEKCFLEFMA